MPDSGNTEVVHSCLNGPCPQGNVSLGLRVRIAAGQVPAARMEERRLIQCQKSSGELLKAVPPEEEATQWGRAFPGVEGHVQSHRGGGSRLGLVLCKFEKWENRRQVDTEKKEGNEFDMGQVIETQGLAKGFELNLKRKGNHQKSSNVLVTINLLMWK